MNFEAKNNHPEELEVVTRLENLVASYKIPEFTSEVIVEKGAIPHSHPILTLNTRSQSDPSLLKVLIHEQFHWWSSTHPKYKDCIGYLKTKYGNDGEHNKSGKYPDSYWEHIIICWNTRSYLMKIFSEDEVREVYNEWQAYPTLEKKIADDFEYFRVELEGFDMIYKE